MKKRTTAKRYVIANWKMQLGVAESEALARAIASRAHDGVTVVLCPSFPALERVGKVIAGSDVALGAQNLFWEEKGQYTGEVSAATLTELEVKYVIVGHSERRMHVGETDLAVNRKVARALDGGITPIVCVGETRAEREAGERDAVVERQVRAALSGVERGEEMKLIVAYEPVWVIGTGKAVEPEDAARSHAVIRKTVRGMLGAAADRVSIIYGGSVDGKNIAGFLKEPDIAGALVGGASQKAAEFLRIIDEAAR